MITLLHREDPANSSGFTLPIFPKTPADLLSINRNCHQEIKLLRTSLEELEEDVVYLCREDQSRSNVDFFTDIVRPSSNISALRRDVSILILVILVSGLRIAPVTLATTDCGFVVGVLIH